MPIWGIAGAAAARFGAKLVRKHIGVAKRRLSKSGGRGFDVRKVGGKWVKVAAPGAATGVALRGYRGGPPALPGVGPRTPQRGPRGVGRRIIPGGRSGYTYDPYDLDTPQDKYGRPVAVHPEMTERIKCPPGYVAVDLDGDGQSDACMLKGTARAMGLWSSRPKPPISGYDARAIKRAERAKKRVKKLAGNVGYKCTTKGR